MCACSRQRPASKGPGLLSWVGLFSSVAVIVAIVDAMLDIATGWNGHPMFWMLAAGTLLYLLAATILGWLAED